METKTWFVTGASQGFGLEFITQLLNRGDKIAATSRTLEGLEKAAGKHDNLLPLEVDLINEQSVKDAIDETIKNFGKIDVVVNNAGYGQLGALEELSDTEARKNFDVNVFGSLNVIRAVMPQLRKQQYGHIINISSIAGLYGGFAGWGIYCATKFAVAGFTESLAAEVKPFGINATVVLPGYFRTNFLESSSLAVPADANSAYAEVRESMEMHQNQINGNQAGDPVKGVEEIIKIAGKADAPLYLLLGSDAVTMAENKISLLNGEIDKWKPVSTATDF